MNSKVKLMKPYPIDERRERISKMSERFEHPSIDFDHHDSHNNQTPTYGSKS
jgi:hypothetical protein